MSFLQKNAKSMNFAAIPTYATKEEERQAGLEDLAGALRILGRMGFTGKTELGQIGRLAPDDAGLTFVLNSFVEGISGHCTLRDPILTDHFWVNPMALDFGAVTVSDLLLLSPEGNIVMGGKPDRQAYNT